MRSLKTVQLLKNALVLAARQNLLELSTSSLYTLNMIKNDKTETITLTLKKSALKKLTKALNEMNEALDENYTVEQYLELELNKNTDAFIEMLMSDY